MPVPRRPPPPPGRISRRQLITAATVAPLVWLTGGCTLDGPTRDTPGAEPRRAAADPDVAVLSAAIGQVEELVELCERAIDERPAAAQQVQPLLQTHRRHAEVLGAASTASRPPQRASPSGTPTRTPTKAPLPEGRTAVLSLLAAAEQRAARAHLEHVGAAESGRFAQLLASISAAESQLAAALEEAVR